MRASMRVGAPASGSSRRLAAAAAPRPSARAGRAMGALPRRAARAAPPPRRRAGARAVALLDYVASANDDGVLKLPARTELDADEIKNVYGYPRNLEERYTIGKVGRWVRWGPGGERWRGGRCVL
jgi:hypothetical protein